MLGEISTSTRQCRCKWSCKTWTAYFPVTVVLSYSRAGQTPLTHSTLTLLKSAGLELPVSESGSWENLEYQDTKNSMHLRTNSCSADTIIGGAAALLSESLHFPASTASNITHRWPPSAHSHQESFSCSKSSYFLPTCSFPGRLFPVVGLHWAPATHPDIPRTV